MHWGNAILLIGMGVVPAVAGLPGLRRALAAGHAARFADPVNLLRLLPETGARPWLKAGLLVLGMGA